MTPEISVIIPFRNARPQLPVLLKALSRQTCARDAFEVIWIDDGSRDGGGGWLQEHLPSGWHVLLHTESRGAYAARNSGLRAAEGKNLAFTDVDCRPQEDWIEKGLAWLSSVPRVAGRVHLELSDSPSAAELVDAGRFLRQRRYVQEGFGATANLFVQRRVFDSLGGFDEHLRSGGDYEFGLRCSLAGIPIQIRRRRGRQPSGPGISSRAPRRKVNESGSAQDSSFGAAACRPDGWPHGSRIDLPSPEGEASPNVGSRLSAAS